MKLSSVRSALVVPVLLLAFTGVSQAQDIYVVNESTNVSNAEVADALPAFQASVDNEFAHEWNVRATLVQTDTAPLGAWVIRLKDETDVFGAAGYHTTVSRDVPYALVGTDLGMSWQLIFSHELFEMLVDPHVDRSTFVWPNSTFYLLEVCDPVEEQFYLRPSASGQPVQISDFATEAWYDGTRGVHDYLHKTHRAHQILDGGYAVSNQSGSWVQLKRVHGRPAVVDMADHHHQEKRVA